MPSYQLRQVDLLKPRDFQISIIGAGGIGASLTLLLAKMGFPKIKVYDFDDVEEVNVGSQWHAIDDIGKKKVDALKENVKRFSGIDIEAVAEKVEKIDTDVLILAVDNMAARKEIATNSTFDFCIDSRMGGETFNVYSFYKEEKERYLKTIFPDSEGVQVPCTGRGIAYNTFAIGSIIAHVVKLYNNLEEKLPFEQNFCFKTMSYSVGV
jgi:molybdopterin/thiamine biosynthesis adenylyltransferase